MASSTKPGAQTPPALGEARQAFRPAVKFHWRVDYELIEAKPPARTEARTRGISVGGTFIALDRSDPRPMLPDVGQPLRLWLHPPNALSATGHDVLRLHGEVRWVTEGKKGEVPRGFGVEFRAVTAKDEILLHECFAYGAKMVR